MITAVSEKTGLRLLEMFREHGNVPFILMLSEHPGFSPAQRSVRLGVANFLMKLSNTHQLLHAMEETLKSEVFNETLWHGEALSSRTGVPEVDNPGVGGREVAGRRAVSPGSVGPSPVAPSTVDSSPVGPSPVGPSTVGPSTEGPSPVGPSPEDPSPTGPSSVRPAANPGAIPGANPVTAVWGAAETGAAGPGATGQGHGAVSPRAPEPVKQAVRYVEENLPSPITLRDVADAVHLNASYLSVLFKKEIGLTFSEFLTRKRLHFAKQLLLGTPLSVKEISRMSGYQTPKYFIELFRSREGMTPRKYRERGMKHLLSNNHGIFSNRSDLDAYCLMAILLSDGAEEVGGGQGENTKIGGLEMLKKAYLLLLASALIFPIGMAGTAGDVLAADVDTVKFMHLWPSGEARQHNQIVGEIIAQFGSEHPDLFVEVEALANEQYKDKITVLAASNSLPDVGFTWAAGYMTPFVQAKQFAPLNDLLAADGLADEFVSGTLQAFSIDGATYGLPLELNIAPIFYNKQIFAANGLDVPTTYEEFVHVVTTLRRNGVTPIALGNGERWTGSLWYMYLADRFAGAEALNDAINGRLPFTHSGLVRAAEEIQRLVRLEAFSRGFNGLSNAEAKAEFLNGQAAMWLIGSWELPQFTTDETVSQSFRDSIGFFRFPTVEGGAGKDTSWVGGPGVALFVNANSEAKDKAEEFVKFFVQQWGERAVAEAGVIPGTIVDTSKVDLPAMYLDVLDELAAASSITLFADVQLSPAAAQVHLNQIQALFGLQVTPEQFARAHDDAIQNNP